MIEGVVIRDLLPFTDNRGWLMELFRRDEQDVPAMSYISATLPGVTRGPHEHTDQADSFCFFSSQFMLGLWDNRPESPTYKEEMIVIAGEANPKNVWVPPGVVHAYRNTTGQIGLVVNFPDQLYRGESKQQEIDEIRHEDDPNTPFTLPTEPSKDPERYFMECAVVRAKKVNSSTWRVKGPFKLPFYVDAESFAAKFSDIF